MHLLAPFILNFFKKKILKLIRSDEMCHSQAQNGPYHIFFLGTKQYYCFNLPIGPFCCENFFKIFTMDPELFAPNKLFLFFFKLYYFHLPISPFHCAKFFLQKSSGSRVMRCAIFGPKMRIFSENLLMSLVSCNHAYLHPKN